MATRKEINKFLKETGYTEEQMETFFEDLAINNRIIKVFKAKKTTWDKLNINLIQQLPTQKEKDLVYHAKLKKEAEEEKIRKEKVKLERDYYLEHFFELMMKKIENKEDLTERELNGLVDYEQERIESEGRRWSKMTYSYIHDKSTDKWYCIEWDQGLTECQENEYCYQPYEVVKSFNIITRVEPLFEKVEHKEVIITPPILEGKPTDDTLVEDLNGWFPQDTAITDHIALVKRVGPDKDCNNES